MKRFIEGEDRSQVTLLPECLDDYIDLDNPVRVVDAFVARRARPADPSLLEQRVSAVSDQVTVHTERLQTDLAMGS